jgi:hypothetical protein
MLGVLRRSSKLLPKELLKLAYIALVRSHLEYASGILNPVAKSHLLKLDRIQKIAARVISHAPRNAHAAPLLEELDLQSLEDRRLLHITDLVKACLSNERHPAFENFFALENNKMLKTNPTPKNSACKKQFSHFGAEVYNRMQQFCEYSPTM